MARTCCISLSLRRCRKTAKFFGRWAGGGLCEAHALELAREHGVDEFHPEYRDQIRQLLLARSAITKDEKRIIKAAGALIKPLGCEVLGFDPLAIDLAIVVRIAEGLDPDTISTMVINRVPGVVRVVMDQTT